jgi:opacity protein-like surface antigen
MACGARLTVLSLAILSLAATGARAADYYPQPQPYYPQPEPQQIIIQQPAPVVDFSEGWYLRGHVGVGITSASQLSFVPNAASGNFRMEQSSLSDAYFIGGGVGYEWNSWLRFELTAEYRAKSELTAFGSFTSGGGTFGDQYHGYLKSWLFLANAFVDLGTWNCFTPFVGAGIGMANNTFSDFTDIGIATSGRGIGRNTSQWDMAWALYAGVAYNVTKSFKVELTYRYLNLGDFKDTIDCVGGCTPTTYELNNVHSHDIMIGFRWACCDFAPPPPPVVYSPPPPPPLRSKG